MPRYRRNLRGVRGNASAIHGRHALPRHPTREFDAQRVSTARRYLGGSPSSRHRSDIGRRHSASTESPRPGRTIMDYTGSLLARFRNSGGVRAVRTVDVPISVRSAGRFRRSGGERRAAGGCPRCRRGKIIVAARPLTTGHWYPRVPGLRAVTFATQRAALVLTRRSLNDVPNRSRQALVPRASECAGRSVVARLGR